MIKRRGDNELRVDKDASLFDEALYSLKHSVFFPLVNEQVEDCTCNPTNCTWYIYLSLTMYLTVLETFIINRLVESSV